MLSTPYSYLLSFVGGVLFSASAAAESVPVHSKVPRLPVIDLARTLRSALPQDASLDPGLTATAPARTSDGSGADDGPTFVIERVQFTGATQLSDVELQRLAADIIDRPVTIGELHLTARRVTAAYRNRGYILALAVVPPQEISDGTLAIRVNEGRIGTVEVKDENGRGGSPLVRGAAARLTRDTSFLLRDLEGMLASLRDVPGLTVRSVLEASRTQPFASDMTLVTTSKPWAMQVVADSFGGSTAGSGRVFAQASASGWLTGAEQTDFTIGSSAPDMKALRSVGISHRQMIEVGTSVTLSASRGSGLPGGELRDLDLRTGNSRLALSVEHKMYRGRSSSGGIALEVARDTSSVRILGERISADRLWTAKARLSIDRRGAGRGLDHLNLEVSHELGGRDAADISRFGAGVNGWAAATRLSGHWPAGRGLVHLEAEAKWASKSQLALREASFGGDAFGRAFDAGAAQGERAVAALVEYRLKVARLGNAMDLQAFAFGEGAYVHDLDAQEPLKRALLSTGGGARLGLPGMMVEVGMGRALLARQTDAPSMRPYVRLATSI